MEKGLYELNEKYNIMLEIKEEDKERLKAIIAWTGVMLDLTIKERLVKDVYPKKGEIWTCHLGENIGSEVNKVRPCLIVQTDVGNKHSPTTIICPISHKGVKLPTHVELRRELLSYVEGQITGTIMTEQIKTVSKARLGRKIGELTDEAIDRVNKSIATSLAL